MPFYRKENNNTILEANNFVYAGFREYELHIENKNNYQYPVDGWYILMQNRKHIYFLE